MSKEEKVSTIVDTNVSVNQSSINDFELFDKAYIVDTNIILDNVQNLKILSDNNSNLIVLPETVLYEIDNFKSGTDAINYNAREFARVLSESTTKKLGIDGDNSYLVINEYTILVLKNIIVPTTDMKNDDIIIENGISHYGTIKRFLTSGNENNITFISNDIVFRSKCIFKDMATTYFKTNYFKHSKDISIDVMYDGKFNSSETFTVGDLCLALDLDSIDNSIMYIRIFENESGIDYEIDTIENINKLRNIILIRVDEMHFKRIDMQSRLSLYGMRPRNLEQRIAWEMLLDNKPDIFVIDAAAGTGKTLLALLYAMKLVDSEHGIDKITYIRKTIISGDRSDEIGYLPGDIGDKMLGYIYPLKDNIESIIRAKYKSKKNADSKIDFNEAVSEFEAKYNIEYDYQGHLRGRTINGAVVILDELQNTSIKDLATILTRMGTDTKVIAIGSTKQIDNPYLNKYNNALTYMCNQIGTYDPIKILGIKLTKVERSEIAKWMESKQYD